MDQDISLCRAAAVEQGIYQTMRLQAVCRNTICSTSMMWRFELAGLFWLPHWARWNDQITQWSMLRMGLGFCSKSEVFILICTVAFRCSTPVRMMQSYSRVFTYPVSGLGHSGPGLCHWAPLGDGDWPSTRIVSALSVLSQGRAFPS